MARIALFKGQAWPTNLKIAYPALEMWVISGFHKYMPLSIIPSGLPSLGSHRVGHDQSDLAAAAVAAVPSWGYFADAFLK